MAERVSNDEYANGEYLEVCRGSLLNVRDEKSARNGVRLSHVGAPPLFRVADPVGCRGVTDEKDDCGRDP